MSRSVVGCFGWKSPVLPPRQFSVSKASLGSFDLYVWCVKFFSMLLHFGSNTLFMISKPRCFLKKLQAQAKRTKKKMKRQMCIVKNIQAHRAWNLFSGAVTSVMHFDNGTNGNNCYSWTAGTFWKSFGRVILEHPKVIWVRLCAGLSRFSDSIVQIMQIICMSWVNVSRVFQ